MANGYKKSSVQLGLFLSAFLCSLLANSQDNILKVQSPKTATKSSPHAYTGAVRAEGMNYITKLPGEDQQNETYLLSADIKYLYSSGIFVNGFEFSAGAYAGGDGSVTSLPELYTSIVGTNSTYALGRKLEFWSTLDSEWNLGLWQGQFTIDALRPAEQGLTGIFYKHTNSKFQILTFVTPMFIPSMGPAVKESRGGLKANRWFRSPSENFQVAGQDTRLLYSINTEDVQKLLANPGGALRVAYNKESEGFWALGNYGYKPINSLLVKYKRETIQPGNGVLFSQVELSPALAYHEIFGGDLGFNYKSGTVALSYIEDRPIQKLPTSSEFIQQVPNGLKAYGATWGHEFSPGLKLTAAYLKIDGGRFEDFNSLGESQGAIFNSRVLFRNSASFGVETQMQFGTKKWINKGKFQRDFSQAGSLLMLETQFYPTQNLGFIGGVDVLGVDEEVNSKSELGFLNDYRANDRVFGGVSYVF